MIVNFQFRLLLGLFSFGMCLGGIGAPLISEFLAKNEDGLKDEDGDESDWIEIYNPDGVAVNLGGWRLTDDLGDLSQWVFPAVNLGAGERLVVFSSGKDRGVSGSELHTNFKLGGDGEYLGLVDPGGNRVSEFSPEYPTQLDDVSYGVTSELAVLLDESSDLSYYIPSGDIGTSWRGVGYSNPSGYFVVGGGVGGVGYTTSGNYTPAIGTNVPNGTVNAYVRIPFSVSDVSELTSLSLEMEYDDAFVAYLNGVEVARSVGAPASVAWNSVSSENHAAVLESPEVFNLSGALSGLVDGNNVLAIQVINRSGSSSDLFVRPRLLAAGGDTVNAYFSPPTPGEANGATFSPGPSIEDVNHSPLKPTNSDVITVTARVVARFGSLEDVTLFYRVMYGGEASVMMRDNGTAGDEVSGDGVYSARIPASASGVEDMVRWRIETSDTEGEDGKSPLFSDTTGSNQSAEYYGTVIVDGSLPTSLPVMRWFTQDVGNSRNRTGSRASFYYDGAFHDNIYVRQRGNATNGSSQKFDFNNGDSFELDPSMPKVGEINMNAQGADGTYLRQPVSFETFRLAGSPSCLCFPVNLRLNKGFDRVGIYVEQVDEDYLKRQNLPEDGALYKFVQRGNLRPALNDVNVGVEKKTRDSEDFSDLQTLVDGLKQSLTGIDIENSGSLNYSAADEAGRKLFLYDNVDIPAMVNYQAATILMQDTDDTRKNFYLYRDTEGSGEWSQFAWDKDYTFGLGEAAGAQAKHPFWADSQHKNPNSNQWNLFYDALHNEPTIREMILRRTRTLMDELYKESSSESGVFFEPYALQLEAAIDPVLNVNSSSLLNEFDERRQDLYVNLYGPNGSEPLIPVEQSSGLVVNFGAIDFNPVSANQDEEYFELVNANDEDLDISGWVIEGGVDFVIPSGTVMLGNTSLYVAADKGAFRGRATGPTGGQNLLVVGGYDGGLSSFGESLTLRDADGVFVSQTSYEGDPTDEQRYLVVSEFMYDPAGGGDGEFLELMNISNSVTLDLTGVKFVEGVEFDFSGSAITSLAPGERVLLVRDVAGFEAEYGTGVSGKIAGVYAGALSNGGERLKLVDETNSTIQDFEYLVVAPWPTGAAGLGSSLVLRDPLTRPDHDLAVNWLAGSGGGKPGLSDVGGFAFWLEERGVVDAISDPDGDGYSELMTYALGKDLAGDFRFDVGRAANGRVALTYSVRDVLDGVSLGVLVSDDLDGWDAGVLNTDYVVTSNVVQGDGTRTVKVELVGSVGAKFLKLEAVRQ